MARAALGTTKPRVGEPPVVCWQARQWQANSNIGSAEISYLTAPQRHPPVRMVVS